MLLIKIYDKSFTPLTTLLEQDFNNLSYRRAKQEIGECTFVVRLDRPNVTSENLEFYNRIEIFEDGVRKFVGVILKTQIQLDTATIRCREIGYIFKKRIMGANYSLSGTTASVLSTLVTAVNSAENTGITLDTTGAVGTINTTFNRANALEILRQVCKTTGNQFEFAPDRTLKVSATIGSDLSASVQFKYNINQIESSNVLGFEIESDGENITTKVYGKSGAYSSAIEDTGLKSQYGLLESYKDFRVANSSLVLDEFTASEIKDKVYSPDLKLNPSIDDNFEVGDTVRVVFFNSLVNLDDSFQVNEKRVEYKGTQKSISVRINDLPNYLAEVLNDRDRRIELLEKQL